jgi:F420H(2)-dependent quinone reductase
MKERRSIRNSQAVVVLMKYFARAHIWVYQRTNGLLGARLLRYPAALITTTGRKTGEKRTTPTLFLREGERVLLPASFGGRDSNPAWYHNLRENPDVHIQIRGEHLDLFARDATDDERRHYWPRLIEMYPPYRNYREATDRVIPLVICEP